MIQENSDANIFSGFHNHFSQRQLIGCPEAIARSKVTNSKSFLLIKIFQGFTQKFSECFVDENVSKR